MIPIIILALIAIALLAGLFIVMSNNNKLKDENEAINEDNKRLHQKINRLDASLSDTTISLNNLSVDYEDLKNTYEDVNHLAYNDTLTELPNREQFYEILESIMVTLRENEYVALSIIRLANYDRITNASGHVVGDELILDFSQRLKANLTEDDFVARIGMDEFAIITQNFSGVSEYADKMGRLNRILHTPFSSGGREIAPVLYTAATIAPQDGKTLQLITLNVRLALANAISEGENKVYFYQPEMAMETMKKMELTSDLSQAVKENSFTFLCGAATDLKTGQTAAFEILPVWECEAYGTMFPKEYLAYAEDTLIPKRIFEMLFRETCLKQKAFENAGYPDISFIVPCFVGQFIDEDFVKIIYNTLEETDATPNKILISVPETVILKKPHATTLLMKKIEKLGIRFMLDDFGSGSSSLKALLRTPVSVVRFSEDIFDGSNEAQTEKILKSLVTLSHSWDLKVIIKGVEYKEQETYLKNLRVDFAEGELYNGYMKDEIALQIARITKK